MIIHAFEKAGLGLAPFRFVAIEEKRYQACHGAPIQPGGMCQFCGTAIVECCKIESSDGKRFIVGNECVKKTYDEGLIDTVKRAMNKLRTEQRHVREQARIAEAKALLEQEEIRAKLTSQPHPNNAPYFRDKTLLDWADWMMSHAGSAGRMQVCKVITSL
jgi:hypothetical protein